MRAVSKPWTSIITVIIWALNCLSSDGCQWSQWSEFAFCSPEPCYNMSRAVTEPSVQLDKPCVVKPRSMDEQTTVRPNQLKSPRLLSTFRARKRICKFPLDSEKPGKQCPCKVGEIQLFCEACKTTEQIYYSRYGQPPRRITYCLPNHDKAKITELSILITLIIASLLVSSVIILVTYFGLRSSFLPPKSDQKLNAPFVGLP